jgi:hypothetical protein
MKNLYTQNRWAIYHQRVDLFENPRRTEIGDRPALWLSRPAPNAFGVRPHAARLSDDRTALLTSVQREPVL